MKKNVKNIILGVLLVTALGGLAVTLSNQNKKPSSETTYTRKDLVAFDFVTSTDNKDLSGSETTVVNFLNSCNKKDKQVFGSLLTTTNDDKTVPYAIKLYQSKELGLRLGSSNSLGGLGINMAEDYTFNRAKITAVNYHRLKTIAEEDGTFNYNKQTNGSSFTFNDNLVTLAMNEDLKVADEKVTSTFSFAEAQNIMTIQGVTGRPCLLSLELWTE